MPTDKKLSTRTVRVILAGYAVIALTLLLLSIANYPVQWRKEANNERRRYLSVYAQAIEYAALDHDGALFPLPAEPAVIANIDSCTFYCTALQRTIPCINLEKDLVPDYMSKMLRDPFLDSMTTTGFYVSRMGSRLTLGSCAAFFNQRINLTKDL
ncbi:MAG: hypothetical protein A3B30_02535 [Candidatus Komeilibacteria bacterium RIFCSPLOWO2_01_FULL_52_15]|uniref:Type II secretion system protein GspG C-terminal domain-containing protein n=2 Tax=Candidatus Komeiliibacteriota TaxID=1817908 RepID=A0A1G2BSM0_9BACT|nr:MAG: hypothetical protein A2677_01475 [Candidatus Komeilibacteria bacterium RIFCSPHIGHO2_01_FULL_52_14]OGY91380.1 MAG: hypothetical protein A3B30_02535 [Candidatus Komeilibacteria bacterium RIFCSPLOWO2_01_FULL_52_15]